MAAVGFGIIGCGMIAQFHARAIAELRGAKLRAVHDAIPQASQRLAEALGGAVDVHEDLDDLLARPDVHVVCICTPSGAHMEPALKAAAARKHVVIEKPLEVNLRRCDQILDACRRNRVHLCTIFPSRYGEANAELKGAIDSGRFGRVTLADTTVKWWRTQQYYDSGGWRGTWKLDGGGALMNQAVHNIDLLQYLMGPVSEIVGFAGLLAHQRIEVEDTAVAALRFKNGALGIVEATTSVYPGLLKTIGVHGDRGSVVIQHEEVLTWSFAHETKRDAYVREHFGQASSTSGGAADPSAISHEGHARQLADFLKAVKSGGRSLVHGDEGRKSVEIILGIYQSQATGKIVKLPLARDPKLPKLSAKD